MIGKREISTRWQTLASLLLVLLLSSCAAGDSRFDSNNLAGFWYGLWHGFISCIAFIIGLFDSDVEIYERRNNGAWYDLGFLLGIGFTWGSGHQSHRRWKGWRDDCDEIPAGRLNVDVTWKPDHDDRD